MYKFNKITIINSRYKSQTFAIVYFFKNIDTSMDCFIVQMVDLKKDYQKNPLHSTRGTLSATATLFIGVCIHIVTTSFARKIMSCSGKTGQCRQETTPCHVKR